MYNIDSFTYWKDPMVKIKRKSIHPLDDPGKTKYYSNESFVYHYLRQTDPFVYKEITGHDIAEQYKEIIRKREEWEAQQRAKFCTNYNTIDNNKGDKDNKIESQEKSTEKKEDQPKNPPEKKEDKKTKDLKPIKNRYTENQRCKNCKLGRL